MSAWVKEKATAIFQRVAVAEGKIHGLPPESVHFHEVGAVDSIVDIVGACIALELLGKPRVISAPVSEGTGWINCAHGKFPIPAPATIGILAALTTVCVHNLVDDLYVHSLTSLIALLLVALIRLGSISSHVS